jgi:hypothetical protein
MIKMILLSLQEQFNKLNKGDILIVVWHDGKYGVRHMHSILYNNELVFREGKNNYFSITKYLKGDSIVKEVYIVRRKIELPAEGEVLDG